MIGKQNHILIALGVVSIALVISITAVVLLQNNNGSSDDVIRTTPGESTIDTEFDYSQYDTLNHFVDKFNQGGGTIKSVEGVEITYSTLYHAVLKDDLLLITSGDGRELWIYHIHDIREIRVNS